jgi:hypothetical protein
MPLLETKPAGGYSAKAKIKAHLQSKYENHEASNPSR